MDRQDRILANIIKSTHAELRQKIRENKEQEELEIWNQHVQVLKNSKSKIYSEAMKNLSNDFWGNETRLQWISDKLNLYFEEKDYQRFITRLYRRKQESSENAMDAKLYEEVTKFNVLDVGSCHNPLLKRLKNSEKFQITAMDLSPACPTVFQGDFLQIPLSVEKEEDLKSLKIRSYDAVIFCLLLEYLPSPKLRLQAVKKALEILKPFGLLLIVTPDSSHQGKNMNRMKSWRLAMAQLNFLRIYIEKLKHVHCFGYVKVEPNDIFKEVFDMEIELIKKKYNSESFKDLENAFYIPQDEKL